MKIIVLAGGKGTRLWPMSRKSFPKQFLPLGNKSLFSQTIDRCLLIEKPSNIFISTNEDYLHYVESLIEGTKINKDNIIVESLPKNTGPAILFAINKIKNKRIKKDELIFVCPSDHFIEPVSSFVKDIEVAKKIAKNPAIVTFGIKPESAETGYGYIETKKSQSVKSKDGLYYSVESFIEKPIQEKANEFLESGNYLWNSGMFLFPMNLIIDEFNNYAPDLVKNLSNFSKIRSVPIDKAVIEKSNKVVVIPASFKWSDIGSWDSFHKSQKKDSSGNVVIGNTLTKDVSGSLILGSRRLVACLGLKDITIIETDDVVFAAPRNRSQEVRELVADLEKNKRREAVEGLRVVRKWGSYVIIEEGDDYKIKKLIVDSKKKLSLQKHKHRSEHWVVVKGKAKVLIGGKEHILQKEESAFVPKGVQHKLENPTTKPLEIIEVQNGNYLGEDDIVRFD